MAHPRRSKIKNGVGGESNAANQTGTEPATKAQKSEDCYRWVVPPDDHDGFKVLIGGKGHVVLTQHRPFGDEVEIVLHPFEARRLQEILPQAIDAAEFLREGGVNHVC